MQKIKKLMAFFLVAATAMATSCGDDEQTASNPLVGTVWQCQILEEWENDGENITWAMETYTIKFDGATNGTFDLVSQIDDEEPFESESFSFTYSFDGKEGVLSYMGNSARFVVSDNHLLLYDPEIEEVYYDFVRL